MPRIAATLFSSLVTRRQRAEWAASLNSPGMLALVARLVWLCMLTVAAGSAFAADEPSFQITTKRADDRVEVKSEKDKATFSIHSPVGISQAVIERKIARWPDAVVLRLYLSGLERFTATNGTLRLDASVASGDGQVRQWQDGQEDKRLTTSHGHWMPIERIGRDGCFELRLPRAMFESNPKSITLHWIDFYRG